MKKTNEKTYTAQVTIQWKQDGAWKTYTFTGKTFTAANIRYADDIAFAWRVSVEGKAMIAEVIAAHVPQGINYSINCDAVKA